MSNIFNLPEATGVSNNDYVHIASPTLGDRKIKVKKLVGDPILTTKNITQNGTYSASSDNADGYSHVSDLLDLRERRLGDRERCRPDRRI